MEPVVDSASPVLTVTLPDANPGEDFVEPINVLPD